MSRKRRRDEKTASPIASPAEALRHLKSTHKDVEVAVFLVCHGIAVELVNHADSVRTLRAAARSLPMARQKIAKVRSQFPGLEIADPHLRGFAPDVSAESDTIDSMLWMIAASAPVDRWATRILEQSPSGRRGARQLMNALRDLVVLLSKARQTPNLGKTSARLCAYAAALLGVAEPSGSEHVLFAVLSQAGGESTSEDRAEYKSRVDRWRNRDPSHDEVKDAIHPDFVVGVFDGRRMRRPTAAETRRFSPTSISSIRPKEKQPRTKRKR